MIRILCVNLSSADETIYEQLYELASPERKARADRYRLREDALRCITADALLRRVLGTDYARVEKTLDGKPILPHRPDFHFNLSHSGNWVAIAWGDANVGLDVESIDHKTNMAAVAQRFFAEEERQYVFAEENDQNHRFFEVWTGKESYLKYLGTGLKKDLTAFSVLSPEPGLWLHRERLPDGSLLCLCTTEDAYSLELLDVQQLI